MVFNWHQITPEVNESCHHKYTWTRLDKFEEQIDYLTAHFKILPLHEAIDRLQRGLLSGACASLTFDDGDISVAEFVVPCLRRRNLPATLFINTAYFDGRHSFWFPIINYLNNSEKSCQRVKICAALDEKVRQLRRTNDPVFYNEVREAIEQYAREVPNLRSRLLSPEWLASLDGEQFAIGAHGHEHQRFSMMTDEWQRKDLQENVRLLSQFKAFKPIFAVPFGREYDWTDETLNIAHRLALDVVLADGGLNISHGDYYRRIPSDGRMLRSLVTATLAGQ